MGLFKAVLIGGDEQVIPMLSINIIILATKNDGNVSIDV